jgi:hypothetical protein
MMIEETVNVKPVRQLKATWSIETADMLRDEFKDFLFEELFEELKEKKDDS